MSDDPPPFANEPQLELRRAPVRDELLSALTELDQRLPLRVPIVAGGDSRDVETIVSTDPGTPDRVVATAPSATSEDVDAAVAGASEAFRGWSSTPASRRADILLAAAAWLRARRPELSALVVRECAKPWVEADADVCEAIDFLEYYARGALALDRGAVLFDVPGERNTMHYAPRGVVAVVSPWNFPLAIPMGMVAAGLATGNTVVLKPAEQSPGCGWMVVRALHEAGVPRGALALLPGDGETGAALVRHPGVHTIAFTGSAEVGLDIVRAAADVPASAHHLKRVIAEMGGKNCVIVDSDADLDEAVPAIVRSAFDYAGQKCSAASRVLVHQAIADALTDRLAGAVSLLVVGQASSFDTEVPPVIEPSARERVEHYVRLGSEAGRVVARQQDIPRDGWFAAPTVLGDLPPASPVLHDEIFGPVLAVERVSGVDEACDRVEALPYGLTGGLFARNPAVVDRVVRRTPVGNFYVNRPITGAMVGRQPFGGNRLSGTGTKAGGPDYLLQFVEPRAVAENTVRHGLAL